MSCVTLHLNTNDRILRQNLIVAVVDNYMYIISSNYTITQKVKAKSYVLKSV